jgi:hypothetical protein
MRLYDTIQQQANTVMNTHFCGLIGNFARALRKAQCFELSPQVVAACSTVAASKPSSIVAATPILRLPYPTIWLEWYGDRGDYMRHNNKIIPARLGCLIETERTDVNNRGYAYWAWLHDKQHITIAPFGIAFDWDPVTGIDTIKELLSKFNLPAHLLLTLSDRFGGVGNAQAILLNMEKWHDQANNEKERDAFVKLERRAAIVPNHYAMDFIKRYNLMDPNNPKMAEFTDDVCGELPFIEAFLIMLNSRHILEKNGENLTRLNKARSKQKKQPLREFTVTNLRLTRTTENRLRAGGMDRNAARIHLVRGHFKIRASGVYWWSSFTRGSKVHGPVPRKEYKVV